MDYSEIISQLKRLDLSKYPRQEIKSLIGKLGQFGVIKMMLHPGKVLIRARPNVGDEKFNVRNQLSYKPAEFNKTYQRASTPSQTMFYAGTIPDDIQKGERDNARMIASLEASNLLRDLDAEGEQTITFSKWVVTKDIPLMAICYRKDFTEKSSHTKELYEEYQKQILTQDKEMQEKSVAITQFFAEEFGKNISNNAPDYNYMISAVFTEIIVKLRRGIEGVYYPSVRADGMGYNVAISPEYADNTLKLVAVGECKMYKKNKNTIVDNETVCLIDDDSKPFDLKPVSPEIHRGRENILQELERRK